MNQPIAFTINDVIALIKAIAALITSIGIVSGAIIWCWNRFKKPNQTQNERLDALEKWQNEVNARLDQGEDHFGSIDKSNKVTQRALLALLSHGLDGNSVEPMREAKSELEAYLIEK